MTLSILIVNFNGLRDLPACLESIRRFAPRDTEVIVADNASTDGSDRLVERDYPWARLVRCGANLGFAAGNNVAGRFASGDFVLLLNPDTVLMADLAPAIAAMDADRCIGALTIHAVGPDGEYQRCTGRFPTPARLLKLSYLFTDVGADCVEPVEVDWIMGAFLLTRREHWIALGGLDERFFMYGEDIDFCKRLNDRGLTVLYLPSVRYTHLGGFNVRRFADLINGVRRYVDLHLDGSEWVAARGVLLGTSVLRLARAIALAGARPSVASAEAVRVSAHACWRAMQ